MATDAEVLAQVQSLLREDKKQEADDLITHHREEQQKAAIAAGTQPAPPAPPRTPSEMIQELLRFLVEQMGSHPRAVELLRELEAALAKL